jgi:hypothetical protein
MKNSPLNRTERMRPICPRKKALISDINMLCRFRWFRRRVNGQNPTCAAALQSAFGWRRSLSSPPPRAQGCAGYPIFRGATKGVIRAAPGFVDPFGTSVLVLRLRPSKTARKPIETPFRLEARPHSAAHANSCVSQLSFV